MTNHIMNTYGRMDVTFSHGEGAWLWDEQGNKYLDALCGIAVTGMGHAHPAIAKAIAEQAGKLIHTSNLYQIKNQTLLADRLSELSGMQKVFFSNSGAEANEAAIKIARKYGHSKGINNPAIIVMENSFHGRTLATLSATGNRKVQVGFEPLVTGFVRAPYNDIESLEIIAKNNPNVVAILVEPVQGEGGVNIPDTGYLKAIRQLCDDNNWLMMLDEIQTGMGRTGKWFAHQHEGIVPDVMSLAKALGNGVPIGACLANSEAAEVFAPGSHGSTFGGNPLACSAALATINAIESEGALENASKMGDYLKQSFSDSLKDNSAVVSIRSKGSMLGITLDRPCADLVKMALAKGLLINVTAESTIRLLPPLILQKDEADLLVSQLTALIEELTSDAL